MTVKLLAIAALVLTLNTSNAQAEIKPVSIQVQAVKPDLKTVALLNVKEIRQQAKRDKLKRVVTILDYQGA
jgi:hypothetical protein